MNNKELTVALVNLILQVLDCEGLSRTSRCHHRHSAPVHRQEPRITLDMERLRQTGGDPGAGSSIQAPTDTPNPRVRVLERPLSPSLDPSAYWPMEPSDPATSLRRRREPPCTIHGWGPYPVASRHLRFSSSGQRDGGEGKVNDEDPIEIFPVLDSLPRLTLRHNTRIQVGAQGRPTGTLAPRSGARELEGGGGVTCDRGRHHHHHRAVLRPPRSNCHHHRCKMQPPQPPCQFAHLATPS
jgi:hypothetical protein